MKISSKNLSWACLFISLSCSFVWAQAPSSGEKKIFRPYTKNLPKVDKVVISKLYQAVVPSDDRTKNGTVTDERTIEGKPVQKVATMWRNLKYRPGLSACHEPSYSLKFYSKGRLIVNASVCWSCNNIFFHTPKLFKTFGYENTQNFDADDELSQELYELVKNAFLSETRAPSTGSTNSRFKLYIFDDISAELGPNGRPWEKLKKDFDDKTNIFKTLTENDIEGVKWTNTMGLLDPSFMLSKTSSQTLADLDGKGFVAALNGRVIYRGVILERSNPELLVQTITPISKNGRVFLKVAPYLQKRSEQYVREIEDLRSYLKSRGK